MSSISFKPLQPSDSDDLYSWRNSPDVARYMYNNGAIDRSSHDAWFAAALADQRRKYWIIELDGKGIGLINLNDIDLKNRKAEWAFYVGDAGHRGKGVGSECESFILDYAFNVLGLNKLTCAVLEFNEGVCRLHERHGFVREGILRQHICRDDGFHNVVVYGMLNSDLKGL